MSNPADVFKGFTDEDADQGKTCARCGRTFLPSYREAFCSISCEVQDREEYQREYRRQLRDEQGDSGV